MISRERFFLFVLLLVGIGCGTPKVMVIDEIRDLDTLVVTASKEVDYEQVENDLPRYNPSYKRTNDLLHTKLELKFDWPKQQVFGIATLTATPLARPQKILQLDAKNFDLHSVKSINGVQPSRQIKDYFSSIRQGRILSNHNKSGHKERPSGIADGFRQSISLMSDVHRK